MANVFRYDDQHTEKPNRNVYNLTKSKSISTNFGQLLPVYAKPVMNGESVDISAQMQLNMLPLVFPVQTRVRASLSFYYCRNRNIWKDWEDFQFKMKPGLVKPYLKFNKVMQRNLLRVGGILDTLGVNVVTKHNVPNGIRLDNPEISQPTPAIGRVYYNPYTNTYDNVGINNVLLLTADQKTTSNNAVTYWDFDDLEFSDSAEGAAVGNLKYAAYRYPYKATTSPVINHSGSAQNVRYFLVKAVKGGIGQYSVITSSAPVRRQHLQSNNSNSIDAPSGSGTDSSMRTSGTIGSRGETTRSEVTIDRESVAVETKYFIVRVETANSAQILRLGDYTVEEYLGQYYEESATSADSLPKFSITVNPADYPSHGIHLTDVMLDFLPYANDVRDDETMIRLDSSVLRHYESIYNALIRNPENNPYMLNGQPEYNKYIHTVEGGADQFNYPMHYANWQDDAFTTALHTPQHGDAPLVGLVNRNTNGYLVTFANDDGTKNRVKFFAASNPDDPSGPRDVRVWAADPSSNDINSPTTPSEGYVGQLQEAMMEAVKFGISINDFRNVNSFQRWLENNVRKGYKYRDQIKAHYGVSVRYDTLDMPEYIGGFTRDMYVNQITQTTENDNGVLGDYAGQAYIRGGSEHDITHYCDEEGFIIGILTVMPTANYSQLLPKWWLRESAFDYYSPEFGKIGMQPILNRELDPIGSFYDGTGDKVFGYQRPWYDYLDDVDTIHGKFRTQFQNFVLTRVFNNVPTLSKDFLVFDPDQVNNIFYVDDNEDKLLGEILFNVKSRIPIPLYGIPALE